MKAVLDKYNNKQYVKNCTYPTYDDKPFRVASICDEQGNCDGNAHREARCLNESQGIICNRTWEFRTDSVPFVHQCPIPPKDQSKYKLPKTDTDLQKEISELKKMWHKYIAVSGTPYTSAKGDPFFEFFYTALRQFKKSGTVEPKDFFKRPDRKQLSSDIEEEGKELKEELLRVLRKIHVSFTIDSYTHLHHHYIAG